MAYEKMYRDNEVAVLYSRGFGAGWYTWNTDHEGLVFDRELVELVLAGKNNEAAALAEKKYGPDIYVGGADGLTVTWLPKGTRFEINEYDGRESVRVLGPDDGFTA
jgi:hypothetical protein